MPPRIDDVTCNGCGICDEHCPVDVLRMDGGSGLGLYHLLPV
ncbi:MAG: 4Fe-4S binding protein [Dehalococcoidia bacterium]|nr:4Fe-4S binding protein [Dehalococcoidia bacterium]